jgi:prepilin-type N-terminal cleavage/methylation domain-containing protein
MKKAFTLIELLIVVAIIAILAAIAVPNFLEAQTRSKVSRAKSDMRTVATGLEAYAVDNNSRYPSDCGNGAGGGIYRAYARPPQSQAEPKANFTIGFELTTPVAYLTSLGPLKDPFQSTRVIAITSIYTGRDFLAMINTRLRASKSTAAQYWADVDDRVGAWALWSAGPDKYLNNLAGGTDYSQLAVIPRCRNYDATNGTISNGDIYRTAKFGDGAKEIVVD